MERGRIKRKGTEDDASHNNYHVSSFTAADELSHLYTGWHAFKLLHGMAHFQTGDWNIRNECH